MTLAPDDPATRGTRQVKAHTCQDRQVQAEFPKRIFRDPTRNSHSRALLNEGGTMRLRVIILAGAITACGAEPTASSPAAQNTSELSNDSDGHGLIFDEHAHPYGASMVSWSE